MPFNQRGATSNGAIVAIVLLVIALVAAVVLLREQDSPDATIEVDIGLVTPEISAPVST